MLEGLRFIGEWRSLLFGVLIVVVMLVRPDGMINRALGVDRLFGARGAGKGSAESSPSADAKTKGAAHHA